MTVEYEYDKAGRCTKMTQGGDHVTSHIYDNAGRVTKTTDPMGYSELFSYDKAGNLTVATDKNGDATVNTYKNGRLSKTTKGGKSIEYTYDGAGNVLTCKDENGAITYKYNSNGTLASQKYPSGKTITYNSYNLNNQLTKMTDYYGSVTTYGYNKRGLVSSIGETYSSETYSGESGTKTTSYTYYADGKLKTTSMPNKNMKTQYTYDYSGRITNLSNTSSNVNTSHAYTYDKSGNVVSKIETIAGTSKTTSYGYDSVNRLTSENSGSYHSNMIYDKYNNLSNEIGYNDTNYYYNANNQLTRVVDSWCSAQTAEGEELDDWETLYTYDANGNMLTSNKGSMSDDSLESNHKTYSYDSWGRLTGFSDSLGKTAAYEYYPDGLRKSKTINGETLTFYYNGDDVINEHIVTSTSTYVKGVDGYISCKKPWYEWYLFKNAHGDVVYGLGENGARVCQNTYSAWGEFDSRYDYYDDSPHQTPFLYAGEYYDYESGMTYLRARYYDSDIKRFITEDPAKDGVNWYAYCGNNPVSYVDPTGMKIQVLDNQEQILEYLDVLTRDTLGIDSQGYVYIKSYNLDADDRPVGTELIYRLICNDNIIKITKGERCGTAYDDIANASSCGTGSTIYWNDRNSEEVDVTDSEGNICSKEQVPYIRLGHELIHAYRAANGLRKPDSAWGINIMLHGDGKRYLQEEYDTVGINYSYEQNGVTHYAYPYGGYFTENALRYEQSQAFGHKYEWRLNYV